MKLLRKKSRTHFDMQHIVFDPSLSFLSIYSLEILKYRHNGFICSILYEHIGAICMNPSRRMYYMNYNKSMPWYYLFFEKKKVRWKEAHNIIMSKYNTCYIIIADICWIVFKWLSIHFPNSGMRYVLILFSFLRSANFGIEMCGNSQM